MKLFTLLLGAYIALFGLVNAKCIIKKPKIYKKPHDNGLTEMENVRFVFANRKEGSKLISKEDDFVNALSDFDRSARLHTSAKVSKEEYLSYISKQTLNWTKTEAKTLEKALKEVKTLMKDYPILFPETIYFVKTNGMEEDNSAYCRGPNVVVFSEYYVSLSVEELVDYCIHELFHIYSKNNLDIREKLYNSIGYYKTGELVLASDVEALKVTNPDSVVSNYYFKGVVDGKEVNVIPVLKAVQPYDEDVGGGFFDYMGMYLGEVEIGETKSTLVTDDNGELKLYSYPYDEVTNYMDTVGYNTGYTIHAEEILADNFVILVKGIEGIPTPEVIENMKVILQLK